MISTKRDNVNGQLKNPFSSFSNPYHHYQVTLDSNLQLLRNKFPHQQIKKLKGLLEEMDNNLQMTIEVLEQETGRQSVCTEKTPQKLMSSHEQNRLLKKAVAELYKKLREKEKETEQLKETNERLKKEKEILLTNNRYLMENEFNKNQIERDDDIF